MAAWIIRVVFNDLNDRISIGLLDFNNSNFISVTFLFRMQRDAVSASHYERTETFKHSATLLKPAGKCNQLRRKEDEDHDQLSKGVGGRETVLCCARRTISMPPPSLLVPTLGWGLIDLLLRASSEDWLIWSIWLVGPEIHPEEPDRPERPANQTDELGRVARA